MAPTPARHSWLEIGNFIVAAIGALATAGLWYIGFHTLEPILANQNLTEKNAQLEIDIRLKTQDLADKQKKLQDTTDGLTHTSDEMKRAEASLDATRAENGRLQETNVKLVESISAQTSERSKLTDLVTAALDERKVLEQQNLQIQSDIRQRDAALQLLRVGNRKFVLHSIIQKARSDISSPGVHISLASWYGKTYASEISHRAFIDELSEPIKNTAHDVITSYYKSEDFTLLDQDAADQLRSDINSYMRVHPEFAMPLREPLKEGEDKAKSKDQQEAEVKRRVTLITQISALLGDMEAKLASQR